MREGKIITAFIASTRRMPDRLFALLMTSDVAAVIMPNVGKGTPVDVITRPCKIWSLMNPECSRQYVIALDPLTSSSIAGVAWSLSLAASCIPVIVVAHQGPVVSLRLQLRFSTCVS